MQIELELLAPAKNKEIGIAAINCGADALYIAGPKFGARYQAGNSYSDIKELVCYAHKFGVKVYIVINTILYDDELNEARDFIKQAYDIGCDAIIVQDLGILQLDLPPIPLFASTQTNIRSVEQAKLLDSFGFKRLILARELSAEQIKDIHNNVKADLEQFVHGALCVSYSGQCYMSQKITQRSANRGECAQACRSNYTLVDENNNVIVQNSPLLSLKDLNLSENLPCLIEAGITSFKIEGRLKGESYIRNVVYNYRQKLDEFVNYNSNYIKSSWGNTISNFEPNINKTFNRGYTSLFIGGKRDKWQSENGAKHIGEFMGKIENAYNNRNGVAEFIYKHNGKDKIVNGDGLCIVTQKGEVIGIRANSCNNNIVTTTEKIKIPINSSVYRNYDIEFERKLQTTRFNRLINIKLSFCESEGSYFIKVLGPKDIKFDFIVSQEFSVANNETLALNNIKNSLSKQWEQFSFEVNDIKVSNVPFFPISVLNSIRREIALEMENRLESIRIQIKKREEKEAKEARECKIIPAEQIYKDYQLNISNKKAELIYKQLGFSCLSPAYEIKQSLNAELMRTKYCIKYQLGFCPSKQSSKFNKRLFLINGNNKFELKFDCNKCEMVVIG